MKGRTVTHKDVRDAALIGQIIARAQLTDACVCCVVDEDDSCGHPIEEHCVASAIGASEAAIYLWLHTSNAIATPLRERAQEIAAAETAVRRRAIEKLYAWVDAITGMIADLGVAELHAAAVLEERLLPPGWTVCPAKARRPR